ncbi:MAG: T9SS type A sorting domain-containing protein [Bacteroidetes bacterium]|nr:T9SS type A sorting domain-containing protein [Bacteroidota bacterium]
MKRLCILLWVVLSIPEMHATSLINRVNNQKATLFFIENKGQIIDQNYEPNPAVKYLFNGPGMNIQLRQGGFSYDVYNITSTETSGTLQKFLPEIPGEERKPVSTMISFHRIDINLVGSNQACNMTASDPSADYLNYYTTGLPEAGATYVHHYRKITYHEVYPNIDLEFVAGESSGAKYNFIVKPGGDISAIRLNFEGANEILMNDKGLVFKTSLGDVDETLPFSYYNEQDTQLPAKVRFTRLSDNLYGFQLEGNESLQSSLIIDPVPLRLWGTYYGGTYSENGYGCSIDGNGNVFLSGNTTSSNAIASSGAHQSTFGGSSDAFLVKFSASGVRQWGTYYGGTADESGNACCVDGNGNSFMAGTTTSSNAMATAGAHQPTYGGTIDAFLVKFNSSGVRLWGTYYGGSFDDIGNYCSVDISGNVFLTGETRSSGSIATPGSHQATIGYGYDAFLVKFNSSGVRQWGTYYGGNSFYDYGYSCCADGSGNVFLAGSTGSTDAIATAGAYQTTPGGGLDAYLVKFNSAGVRQWGSYYGGTNDESGYSCSVDLSGNIFLAGQTNSINAIATTGAFQTTLGGSSDAFLVKFNSSMVRQWGTYYGGASSDLANSCISDGNGNIFLTGYTHSTNGIASAGAHQPTYGGICDAFLTKFAPSGLRQWGTYYGGDQADQGSACSVDGNGNVVLGGTTSSTSAIATTGAYQTTLSGSSDAFLVKFNGCIPDDAGTITGPSTLCSGLTGIGYSIPSINNATAYTWTLPSGCNITSGANTNSIIVSYAASASSGSISVYATNSCGNGSSSSLSVTVNTTPVLSISGNNSLCINSGYYNYSTQAGFSNYIWTISSGGVINAGQGTSQVQVNWNTAGSQWVAVTCTNVGCSPASPTQYPVSVNNIPGLAGSITGSSSVCTGQRGVSYSVPSIPYTVAYVWTLPPGANNVNGSGTNTITVDYSSNATSGNMSVVGSNICGFGNPSPNLPVTLALSPPKPGIALNGVVLTSTAPTGNQWYYGVSHGSPGYIIPSATNPTYTATQTGYYWTVVTSGNCQSEPSDTLYVIMVGIPGINDPNAIQIYPNPNTGRFNLMIATPGCESFRMKIINELGVIVYQQKFVVNGKLEETLDPGSLPEGVYTLVFSHDSGSEIRKMTVVR